MEYIVENTIGELVKDKTPKQVEKQFGFGNIDDLFAVIIKGDSMNERVIDGVKMRDGYFAIIKKDESLPNDGQPVLAIIDGSATLKNFYRGTDKIILKPESSNKIHQPIYLTSESEGFINGRVVAVLENPS